MASPRGEFHLLDLEEKALAAIKAAWDDYEQQGKVGLVPTKLVGLIVEVHKMIMQRMSAKYGLDAGVSDLRNVRSALARELAAVDEMIEQQGAIQ